MRNRRIVPITVVLLFAALLFAALISRGGDRSEAVQTEGAPASVRVVRIDEQGLEGEIRAGGFLRANADVTISAERAGRVVALPVAEGKSVAAGVEIATLDDTAVSAQLAEARAVEREAALNPSTPAAQLASAQARLRQAEYEFRLRHPVAPHTGTIEVHHVEVGGAVAPGSPLVDLIDASVLLLDIDVDAEFVVHLAQGRPVSLDVPALGETTRGMVGTVRRVASRADTTSRRFRIEIELDPGSDGLRPGMYAEARLTTPDAPPALYVPKAFARTARGETGVYVVRDGRARWVPLLVDEVYSRPDLWRVAGGELAAGDQVVASGFSGLRDGMPVEVER